MTRHPFRVTSDLETFVSYPFYKIMHFVGIFMMLVALAATCMHAAMGGSKADNPFRKALGATHGIAALLILTGGFGMLAGVILVLAVLAIWFFPALVTYLPGQMKL